MKWIRKRVYADAAAAMPLSGAARRELRRLEAMYGNPGALHREALAARRELAAAREKIARAIGAHADEIFFTGSGTEANNLALQGALRPVLLERGEAGAVTTAIEHSSVLEPLRALEREGLYTTQLSVDEQGLVNPKDMREAVSGDTALVSVQMVNSEVGTVQDIRAVAKEIRHIRKERMLSSQTLRQGAVSGHGDFSAEKSPEDLRAVALDTPSDSPLTSLPIYLHTDAAQAPLWMPLNVERLGVDLMTLDAQKVGGPKGVGVLYVRRGTSIEPIIFGGGQEQGLRSGTENVAGACACAAALAEAQASCEKRAARTAAARDFLWSEIKRRIPDAVLNGPELAARVVNNLNISIPGLDGEMAVIALDAKGIAASTRSACDTGEKNPSHVLQALGVGAERARSALRLTLLPTATRSDARAIAKALESIVVLYRHVL